jgi:hypothetical protein
MIVLAVLAGGVEAIVAFANAVRRVSVRNRIASTSGTAVSPAQGVSPALSAATDMPQRCRSRQHAIAR